jgi:hypothetical protein
MQPAYITDERLSGLAVGILARMLADPSYPRTIKGIAARSHEGKDAVGKARKLLKQYGYLVDERAPGFQGHPPYTVTHVTPEPRIQGRGRSPEPRFLTFGDIHRNPESGVAAASWDDDEEAQVSTGTLESGSHDHRDVVATSTGTDCVQPMASGQFQEQVHVQESSSTTSSGPYSHMGPRNQGPGGRRVPSRQTREEYEAAERARAQEELASTLAFLDEVERKAVVA